MITLTFKNVDQGDSILLEWQKDGIDKIAIIDCNQAFNTNPVLEHIITKGYSRIEFLLLSHPHSDHFSGFTKLIRHCIDHGIKIGHFLSTSPINKNYWEMAFDNAFAKNETQKLFKLLREARTAIGMKTSFVQGESLNPPIKIGNNYFFELLGPTAVELDKFITTKVVGINNEEEKGNNPSANWLSSLIKIYTDDTWYILLTADVNPELLLVYGHDKDKTGIFKGNLVLGQSPHHGSKLNHKNSFWKNLKRKKDSSVPIVFSVGKNNYGHPSKEAVEFFQRNKFKIYSTNPTGILSKNVSPLGKSNIAHASTFGLKISKKNNDFEGDKIFEIDISGNVKKM